MGNDSRTLYLLLTITFLALLTSLFLPVNGNYRLALFTTIGLPAVYSARYFSKRADSEDDLTFFKNISKKKELVRDFVAVTTAYIVGYIVYMATSADFTVDGLFLYSVAFAVVLVLRYLIAVWYRASKNVVDPDNPLVIVFVAFVFAVVGLVIEMIIFLPLPHSSIYR